MDSQEGVPASPWCRMGAVALWITKGPSCLVLESLLSMSWREGPKPLRGRGMLWCSDARSVGFERPPLAWRVGKQTFTNIVCPGELFCLFLFLYRAGLLKEGCSSSALTSCCWMLAGGGQNHLWTACICALASYPLATWKLQSFPLIQNLILARGTLEEQRKLDFLQVIATSFNKGLTC